ncbi:hypothetical protein ALUC_30799A [Aspergillus luchuensis]|nr:hypothetical protein ALUC_30799A [Aspergillus luchuensis]
MASVTLESLPVELIEEIVAWLDFHDHCALRLTGRTISVKSSNAAFRNYFLSRKWKSRRPRLSILLELPSQDGSGFGCSILLYMQLHHNHTLTMKIPENFSP